MKNLQRLAIASVLILAASASAQDPDASLWSGDVNPDGSQIVPVVSYDPSTGLMSVNTAGMNQAVDSADCLTIGGDDAGMISILITGPEPLSFDLDGFQNGVVWGTNYFNGKAQAFGVAAGCQFLEVGTTQVMTYDMGLTEADFGEVEMAVNYELGVPGGIIFGGVQIVPEPSSLGLMVVSLLGLIGFVRRR
ncbi:MAG: PEP-CTERM sorting domain-containing protein [Planctomycetota bacterium]